MKHLKSSDLREKFLELRDVVPDPAVDMLVRNFVCVVHHNSSGSTALSSLA